MTQSYGVVLFGTPCTMALSLVFGEKKKVELYPNKNKNSVDKTRCLRDRCHVVNDNKHRHNKICERKFAGKRSHDLN